MAKMKSISLSHEQAMALYCYIDYTESTMEDHALEWRKMGLECNQDGSFKYPNAPKNAMAIEKWLSAAREVKAML